MINRIKIFTLSGICLFLLFLLLEKGCELKRLRQESIKSKIPDTVYVSKPYKIEEIKKEHIEKPATVYVYPEDTILRNVVEQKNIITGINIRRGNIFNKTDFIKIDKISPLGIITSNEYKMPPLRLIKIDLNGGMQVKKKRYPGLKMIAGALAIGTTGYFIHQGFRK